MTTALFAYWERIGLTNGESTIKPQTKGTQ